MPQPINYSPSTFTLLAKPAGAACNLACAYCFYLGKQKLYPGSRMRMPDEVLKAYVRQMLHSHKASDVSLSWQGGEPTLMGLDFFKRLVQLVNIYKKPRQRVKFTLQTNGTLLDDEWCAFFKQHNFLIGLSLDGPAQMHDAFRVNQHGMGSFERVIHGWELLQKHHVDTNLLCALHAANASHPLELYRFFRDRLQARFIQFIPIVERLSPGNGQQDESGNARKSEWDNHHPDPDSGSVSPASVKPDEFGSFLIDIFEEWVHHDVGSVFIQTFESALASWCHLPASVCVFQEVCGASLVLEHNGDLYSCDHFVDPGHYLGNILQVPMIELASSPDQRRFGVAKRDLLPAQCLQCEVLFACHGECPRNRFLHTADGDEKGLNYLCAGYKRFFKHIDRPMRLMADLLRRGRSPAEIMEMI